MKVLHKIRSVPIGLLVFLFLVTALAVRCGSGGRPTAGLSSITSDVERYDGQAGNAEPVPEGEKRTMYEGDGVDVDDAGRAHLDMGGCLLEIFRKSGLQIGGLPSQSAPVCIVDFEHGTIYNRVKRQTIIQTEWAVITSLSTEFLVHLDPDRGLLWVVVVEGVVRVEAAGRVVVLQAGEQTWVPRGRPPEPPRPATRAEVGDLFPPVEDLTNGVMIDGDLLEPGGEEPTEDLLPEVGVRVVPEQAVVGEVVAIIAEAGDDRGIRQIAILIDGEIVQQCSGSPCEFETEFGEPGAHSIAAIAEDTSGQRSRTETRVRVVAQEVPLTLELSQSTDEVIAGECPGDRTVQIQAGLAGPVAGVEQATLSYSGEGIEGQTVQMERVDDQTFVATIGPFDYCCQQTIVEYTVEVFSGSQVPAASRSGEVLVSFCIG